MEPGQAAAILREIADLQAQAVGDLAEMEPEQAALVESSGDLLAIQAMRLGAEVLEKIASEVMV